MRTARVPRSYCTASNVLPTELHLTSQKVLELKAASHHKIRHMTRHQQYWHRGYKLDTGNQLQMYSPAVGELRSMRHLCLNIRVEDEVQFFRLYRQHASPPSGFGGWQQKRVSDFW